MNTKIFFMLAALGLFAASCQKEIQPTTLNLSFEHFDQSKMHLGEGLNPNWDPNDQVRVNGEECAVLVSSNASTIEVTPAESYAMVFPASIVGAGTGTSIGRQNVAVTLPYEQTYIEENGVQKLTAPMCAYIDATTAAATNNVQIRNLGAIIQVNLANRLGSDITLQRIRLESENCKLSGNFVIDDLGSATPTMTYVPTSDAKAYSDKDTWVSLSFGNSGLAMEYSVTPSSFYICVPPCATAGRFALEVYYTRDGSQYRQAIVSNGNSGTSDGVNSFNTIGRNQILSVSMNLTTSYERLIPEDPYNVNAALKTIANNWQMWGDDPDDKIEIVMFQFNSGSDFDVTKNYVYIGGTRCYAQWDSEQKGMIIHVPAASLTNVDFSGMFAYMTKLVHVMFQGNLPGGEGTITATGSTSGMFAGCSSLGSVAELTGPLDFSNVNLDAVTNTSYMFRGCTSLSEITWPTLGSNAATVTDMRLMFANCTNLQNVVLPNFRTAATTNMKMMFGGCTNMRFIQLDPSFVVANLANRQDMLYQTGKDSPDNCLIHCTDEQWAALQTGTGMDPTKCFRDDGSK